MTFKTLHLIWVLSSGQISHLLLPFTVTKPVTSREISRAVESRDTRAPNWQVLAFGTGFNGVSSLLPTMCTVSHHNVFGRIRYNGLWTGRLVFDRRNATASRSSREQACLFPREVSRVSEDSETCSCARRNRQRRPNLPGMAVA